MKINIGGDFCIISNFLENSLFDQSIINLFKNSDYNIINLECPITTNDIKNKIIKTGPHLHTDDRIINYLKILNINLVTLANNHIMDYGEKGLMDTINKCEISGINYVGAGKNIIQASKPLIINHENLKIAFINFCENEWSIASENVGGANPLDVIDNLNHIKKVKQFVDKVIVIVHGGHEYYQLPSPRMIKQYRFFADNGADAVIGHHTHCIGGYEIYNNVPIVYSLGNFIFTLNSNFNTWYSGLIAQLDIKHKENVKIKIFPVVQHKKSFITSLANAEEKNNILLKISEINSIIKSPALISESWKKMVDERKNLINHFSPINAIPGKHIKAVFNRIGFTRLLLNDRLLKNMLNLIRCESHRDIIVTLMNNKLKNNENSNS